jgi:hypothetical protein
VWRAGYLGSFPDLAGRLAERGYGVAARFPGERGARVLYTRPRCGG